MTGAYSTDYVNVQDGRPTPDQVKWRELCQQVQRLEWTEEDFLRRVDTFIAENPWQSWKVAEFLTGAALPKVYPHTWYLARCAEDRGNAEAIGCYQLPEREKPVFGWKHEIGTQLPAWQPPKENAPAALLPASAPEPPSAGPSMATVLKENLKLQCRVEELERTLDRLKKEMQTLRQERLADQRTIAELQGFEQGYLDTLELLALTETLEKMDPDTNEFHTALSEFTAIRAMHLSSYRDQWEQEDSEDKKAA